MNNHSGTGARSPPKEQFKPTEKLHVFNKIINNLPKGKVT